ncbi:MAG: transglycosylase domain-containing protein [Bacteroidales bacterium]|jgi:penicillin-binding protein 1A|nr:transglycosylase domain-containing protein [Bacteroidales bacterium]
MDKNKENNSSGRKKIWICYIVALALVVAVFVGISSGIFGFMPSFEELENPESSLATEIISSDQQILGTYYVENRSNVNYSDLAPCLVNALVATEDARFYNHSGIDIRSLARVIGKTIIGGHSSSGGGSTITQQLAKNLFPRKKQNKITIAFRKLKEWVIAIKLERNYTKEEIIAMYFNTVDFGNNAFGIKTAAVTYFGKSASELKVDEAAILVGMLKATSRYNPVQNPENSFKRRNIVLSQMYKNEYISKEEYDHYSSLPIDMSKFTKQNHQYGLATYMREHLRMWLGAWCKGHRKPNGQEYNLYKDGLKVYTTVHSKVQRYAEEAVAEWMSKEIQPAFFKQSTGRNAPFIDISEEEINREMRRAMRNSDRYRSMKEDGKSEKEIEKAFHTKVKMRVFSWNGEKDTVMSPWDSLRYHKFFLHAGLISIEPQTGYIRAYIGGINYKYFQYDNVSSGRRQVGSTFKPFIYTLAIQERNYKPCTKIPNVQVCISQPNQPDWCPKNSSTAHEGEMVTLGWALANSVNFVSAYLMKQISPQAVIDLARHCGITAPMEAVPSLCLGTADISVKEMASAMSTFANKGIHVEPLLVTRIEDRNGVVLEEFSPTKEEAMSENTAYTMIDLMKHVVDEGTAGRLRYKYGITQPIAGKTGTTQNNSDGWFMGLTPDLVTGIWVGGEVRSIHFRSTALGQGANTALPIWGIYMKKIYSDPALKDEISQEDFEKPENYVPSDCAGTEDEVLEDSSTQQSFEM